MSNHIRPIVGYKTHKGTQLHFCKDSYNIFINGFPQINGDTFDKRNDAKLYAAITSKLTKDEVFYFFLANVLEGNNDCLYNFSGEAMRIYKDYVRKIESVSYNFYDELTTVSFDINSVDELYKCVDNEPPLIVQYLIGGLVSMETFCLIQLHCYDILNIQYTDYLWNLKKEFIKKYLFFFSHKYIKYNEEYIINQYENIFN